MSEYLSISASQRLSISVSQCLQYLGITASQYLKVTARPQPASALRPHATQVRFAAFGLGNRQYEHFNSMGKWVDARMTELGAQVTTSRLLRDPLSLLHAPLLFSSLRACAHLIQIVARQPARASATSGWACDCQRDQRGRVACAR